ncbi:102290b1-78cb-4f6d-9bf2-c219cdeaf64d [Sclerotinia trifoliorum]|uniref:102290b1-78cb-4f6d-9bf2-c219cdeaf64d n=1 Tax=Sclerotinia trifoliorum TaxID=28548 RepID=A0A8H2W050_9HELO|nr:102290b1-78cb-4f6d-9bf2-c219cdeaf64d [Sclerotinia trifoliorum]
MDGYATAWVAHNLPLLVVSGLGADPSPTNARLKEGGVLITSDIAPLQSEDAKYILKYFKTNDAENLPWNGSEHSEKNKFKVKVIGRDYILPSRKAPPPTSISHSPDAGSPAPNSRFILHSPLSPLTPGATLFPDGLLDTKWIDKHQDLVPSAYLSFYNFTSDPNLATLHDNQLKTDINNIKNTLNKSGYKTRLIVALLSETPGVPSSDVEERLSNIRKGTGLDSKTSLFFLPPQSSPVEIEAFVETIYFTIYPLCIEYYRDLSKHSRRKRNRGVVPPPTAPPTSGTSQTLTGQGWNVRYDFKLGVFAEFRQEMDVAVRSFESGYEALLGEEVLETIATWSPRFNEGRLIADVFAIRVLRCLLWNGHTSTAVRRWQLHRDRVRDFVDRRGKGSSTYGWQAWEARWATIMAEMIEKVGFVDFTQSKSTIYLPLDKLTSTRTQPWENLHHPGFWYREASKHLMARRALALTIPEEDRSPPGSSPASQIASRVYTYDTYLCPQPHEENPLPGREGVDHANLIIDVLNKAIAEFQTRGQHRLVQELLFQCGKEHMRLEAWDDALRILRALWQKMTYRNEGWWVVVEEIAWTLRKAAAKVGDGGTIVAVDWELLHTCFSRRSNWHYNIKKSLDGLSTVKVKPAIVLHVEEVQSFLTASYAFEKSEGKVGEHSLSQLAIRSSAIASSTPVTINDIRVEFTGGMKPMFLRHKAGTEASEILKSGILYKRTSLVDESTIENGHDPAPARHTLAGYEDLTFRPGQIKAFEFVNLLREAGDVKALRATFSITSDLFDFDYVHSFDRPTFPEMWYGESGTKKKLVRTRPSSIHVLPKPPKLELRILELQDQYYTNELVSLHLEVKNGEDTDSVVDLEARLLGENVPSNIILRRFDLAEPSDDTKPEDDHELSLGTIASGSSVTVEILISSIDIPAVYDLNLKASYNLVTDLETPISQAMSAQLSILNPFEANYDFSPRIHPDPWPSFFTHEESLEIGQDGHDYDREAFGLAQKWCLTTRFASFATEDIIVEDVDVEILGVQGGIKCSTKRLTTIPEGGVKVSPRVLEEAQFDTFTQKYSLDDRGTATLDLSLVIKWRRDKDSSTINTCIVPVPRLLVSSSEPRVLAAVTYSSTISSMIHFDVTIENPSHHFLSFAITMEPSEQFAFSGVKQSTLQLVPLSRRTIKFRLLPTVRGDWIGPIRCVIRDRYFQKVLKIAPTEGMKSEKEGLLIWVPSDEEF